MFHMLHALLQCTLRARLSCRCFAPLCFIVLVSRVQEPKERKLSKVQQAKQLRSGSKSKST